MAKWLSPEDMVVGFVSGRTIGEAIEESIREIDAGCVPEEEVKRIERQIEQISRVLKVFADLSLTDQQEMTLGKSLHFKEIEE